MNNILCYSPKTKLAVITHRLINYQRRNTLPILTRNLFISSEHVKEIDGFSPSDSKSWVLTLCGEPAVQNLDLRGVQSLQTSFENVTARFLKVP